MQHFADIQGPRLPKPRFLTLAKMRWDDYYLYIGAYLEETDVWANETKHNSVSEYPNVTAATCHDQLALPE